jgi:diadenosine tetraphosphate (Ap4A) HIT family hydrolase
MTGYERVSFDVEAYTRYVQEGAATGRCFICEIVQGLRDDHLLVFRDDVVVAFLAKAPTLLGCCLVAPVQHRTNVVADFTEDEYLAVQERVHRVGRALIRTVPTERLYILSLGSHQGNAHVHWHVAPLPPGVPYDQQQYAALMHENGYLHIPDAEQRTLAERIRREFG